MSQRGFTPSPVMAENGMSIASSSRSSSVRIILRFRARSPFLSLSTLVAVRSVGTPGKTQTINFFDVNRAFYFVDLPGYGYAKVPDGVKKEWSRVMTAYLRDREPLRLVVQLLDARRAPTERDDEMMELLEPYRGQRGRVIRLLQVSRIKIPRYGPRFAPGHIERL